MLTLEELGATGAKGLVGVTSNPVIATGLAGLAAAANAQAALEVCLTAAEAFPQLYMQASRLRAKAPKSAEGIPTEGMSELVFSQLIPGAAPLQLKYTMQFS